MAARAVRRRAGGEHATVAVVVTLGEQGMILIDPEGTAWHGVVDAHGDYPVGSGDAFLAGLLTALAADPTGQLVPGRAARPRRGGGQRRGPRRRAPGSRTRARARSAGGDPPSTAS